jgi:Mg-chelatase subunit ChlI
MPGSQLVRHQGNRDLWTAALVSAASLLGGVPLHLHAEGPRGTGKTTLLRALARQLPPIERVAGCPYNCDPRAPHCPLHRGLDPEGVRALGRERVPVPFVEVSASAKLATVVGSIDLGRLLDREHPEAALLPGSLARAHRGILFVDEVNRLADVAPELTDALLDVMGTKPGRLQIEEAGLPTVVLPVSVTVWAASNPDEEPGPLGEIRLQLADRFDLRVRVRAPEDRAAVLAVLDPRQAHAEEPVAVPAVPAEGAPSWPPALLASLADAYLHLGFGSLRALLAWRRTAEVLAALEGRPEVAPEDVARAARLTLADRLDPDRAAALAAAPPATGAPAEAEAASLAHGEGPGPMEDRRKARPLETVRPLVAPEWTGP